ncbi:MAG: 5-dehydro-2-deoxygluconokinase, partial [Rhodospirillaceae bacterium]|nr:5-dehydro-2-deoxygluconokinase [Rhodospirillaceae bacterium]
MDNRKLDVICLGRSSVDLYGDQVGGPLEDMQSFSKYIGGCATNIAVGTSRLGLKSALITRVGDEQMGRFIRQTLLEEGVDVSHVSTDPDRLTALVILGIRDLQTFPHIFYRENCADMGVRADHISKDYIASAKAVVLTGTHFSEPGVEEASRTAIRYAKEAGTKVVLDIDYRPVLWGLTSHGDGENRFVESDAATKHVQSIVVDCDLVVGTEEEIHVAGGSTDTIAAVKSIRALSDAVIVVKRGPMGCVVFPDAIPDDLDDGIWVKGKEIEVYNTLGAGDGFMSGFLRGWIKDETWETCCTYGNASGAIVVSRHACSPEIPSWEELQDFLENGSPTKRLREDAHLNHLHRVTNRSHHWEEVCAIAFDHRAQFEEMAEQSSKGAADISAFKKIIASAAMDAVSDGDHPGVLIDDKYGFDALAGITGGDWWTARPVELPGSLPLRFEAGENIATVLSDWPRTHVAKCLVQYHPDDDADLKAEQINTVSRLYDACIATGHDLLLEVIPPSDKGDADDAVIRAMAEFYDHGIKPDWWKL